MNALTETVVTIATAIVGLAIVAVLVSKNSQTPQVIQSAASGFNNALGIAEAPVTGISYSPVLSYPNGTGGVMAGGFGQSL